MSAVIRFSPGFPLATMFTAAASLPMGQQKAKFASDVAGHIGANPVFEIRAGSTVKYRTTIAGSLTGASSGITIPAQLVEPPSLNLAEALTGDDCVIAIRSATNASLEITIPVKVGGTAAAGFLNLSKPLSGLAADTVRTSALVLAPPTNLDGSGDPSASGLYKVQTLLDDMTRGNPNDWYIEAAPNTAESHHGMDTIAQVNIGLRRSDGRSHWPGYYLTDDNNYDGITLTNSTIINNLPWWVIGRALGQSGLQNVRVQLRRHRRMILRSNDTWETSSSDAPVSGSQWHAYFRDRGQNEMLENMVQGTALHQVRSHSPDEGGGESVGSIGYGTFSFATSPIGTNIYRYRDWAGHGFSNSLDRRRDAWTTYKAVLYMIEHRLIMHDPNGPDNRANTALLLWLGADWRKDSARGPIINAHCQGALTRLTSEWQLSSCGEFNPQDLRDNPPPGFS